MTLAAALFLGIAIIIGLVIAGLGMLVLYDDANQNRWVLLYALITVLLAILVLGREVYQLGTIIVAATG